MIDLDDLEVDAEIRALAQAVADQTSKRYHENLSIGFDWSATDLLLYLVNTETGESGFEQEVKWSDLLGLISNWDLSNGSEDHEWALKIADEMEAQAANIRQLIDKKLTDDTAK